jgi:hypothetical protein
MATSTTTTGWILRVGSYAGIAGALLGLVGNLLHPATPIGDPEGVARTIALAPRAFRVQVREGDRETIHQVTVPERLGEGLELRDDDLERGAENPLRLRPRDLVMAGRGCSNQPIFRLTAAEGSRQSIRWIQG